MYLGPRLQWRGDFSDDCRCNVSSGCGRRMRRAGNAKATAAAATTSALGGHGGQHRLLQHGKLVDGEVSAVVEVGGGLYRLDQLVRRRGCPRDGSGRAWRRVHGGGGTPERDGVGKGGGGVSQSRQRTTR